MPFLSREGKGRLLWAAAQGMPNADKMLDPSDHHRRPWGAAVPLPLVHDPPPPTNELAQPSPPGRR